MGDIDSVEDCMELCDTDENGCNFVWFTPADGDAESECKMFTDVLQWKPRVFLDRGIIYSGRLCFENDPKIACLTSQDCYVTDACNMEQNACQVKPPSTEESTTTPPVEPLVWCPASKNYPNHAGVAVDLVSDLSNMEECKQACDDYEGCNFVWFIPPRGANGSKCRIFQGVDGLKPKSKSDVRTHINYAGRLCTSTDEKKSCNNDLNCYYMDHCNLEENVCEPGAPVTEDGTDLMKVDVSPIHEFGLFQLLFAAVGAAALLYGSYTTTKSVIFGRENYTFVPTPAEEV